VTDQDPQLKSAEAAAAEARSEVAVTDARRAEEKTAQQHEAVEEAERREEKLSRKERKAKEKAEQVAAEADRARAEAGQATAASPATATAPPVHPAPASAAQRPEVLVGAAFGGAFILARVLKRIFD
jgi:chemotaxis response regulator CheB